MINLYQNSLYIRRTQHCQDADGNKILFATKSKSDSTILWKGTIKIACVKYKDINNITDYRLLSLNEFIKVISILFIK